MGRRTTRWSEKVELRRLKEGRGSGEGADYRPWITTHDFPSLGQVCRARGETTGRIHHMMSSLERDLFLILDYDPEVTDIQEQYPLPLYETQLIAADLGVKHPEANDWSVVMTTDFLYCRSGIWHAAAVKPSSELDNERVMEKLDIERCYWEKHSTDWKIQTEKTINRTRARNILWITGGRSVEELIPSAELRIKLEDVFVDLYQDEAISFHDLIDGLEQECALPSGTVIQLFKHLVRKGRINLDLNRKFCMDDPRRISREEA
jgi:hypothetical protein